MNKKAQIRNQTLFQHEASPHKGLEGPPEIDTVSLSRGLGVWPKLQFCPPARQKLAQSMPQVRPCYWNVLWHSALHGGALGRQATLPDKHTDSFCFAAWVSNVEILPCQTARRADACALRQNESGDSIGSWVPRTPLDPLSKGLAWVPGARDSLGSQVPLGGPGVPKPSMGSDPCEPKD